jgi:predicted Zn-ribbon and HTH transcriptional regulator
MAERKTKEISGYREIERRERIKHLAELMVAKTKEKSAEQSQKAEAGKKHNPPQIYVDELEKGVDEIIEREAIELYKKLTGKRKIPEEIPQEYKDRALMEVLKRWQQTLKEIKETAEKTAVPLETRMDMKALGEVPPICPKCGVEMKKIIGSLYQCPRCFRTIRL